MEPMDRGAVTGTDVWPAILTFLEGAPSRKLVASAFIGSEGATLLHSLGRGDLLICNASPAALRQGSTYPSALRTLHTRGVTIRSVRTFTPRCTSWATERSSAPPTPPGPQRVSTRPASWEDPSTVAVLRRDLEKLSTSTDADNVNTAFLDVADLMFRPARALVRTARQAHEPDKQADVVLVFR